MIKAVLLLLLPLLGRILTLSPTEKATYYIKPASLQTNTSCSDIPCEVIDFYVNDRSYFSNKACITMIFMHGEHQPEIPFLPIHLRGLQNLTLKGSGCTQEVVIHNVHISITEVAQVHIENLTITDRSHISVESAQMVGSLSMINLTSTVLKTSTITVSRANLYVQNCRFLNSQSTVITLLPESTMTLYKHTMFFNNTGTKGGALSMTYSKLKLANNATVLFHNNHAKKVGGAIYVDNPLLHSRPTYPCFYELVGYEDGPSYSITFLENSAEEGGDHIYGAIMESSCPAVHLPDGTQLTSLESLQFFNFSPTIDSALSSVSSNPQRVCICYNGKPQCDNFSTIFITDIKAYPGQAFPISAVVVGGDFGTTIGSVYANLMPSNSLVVPQLGSQNQYSQMVTTNNICTELIYSINSTKKYEIMYLTTTNANYDIVLDDLNTGDYLQVLTSLYKSKRIISLDLLRATIFINVTLRHCPPGFILIGNPPGCDCHTVLTHFNMKCSFVNETGYISWKSNRWINAEHKESSSIIFSSSLCPADNCRLGEKEVDLEGNPDDQCAFNHSGMLCGGCKNGNSLAIGSSHCIYCPNNNNLALLIFFVAAGFLLVFFIGVLNLTVTQGMINGLIFYGNIVWAYQGILFPQYSDKFTFKPFIAWLNLDFGIKTCFFVGLDAFWKTWLQFVFPLYIWIIAGFMILMARYSIKLTKIFGNKAVPVLDTLFLLSYMKLLRTIIEAMKPTVVTAYYEDDTQKTSLVWTLDGRLDYFKSRHGWLVFVSIATLVFLWLPYTLLLVLVQWLRRLSNHRLLKWIPRLKPVYDTHFAPLKDNHQYWFGVLLLVRGILYIISLSPNLSLNLLLMQVFVTLLLFYMALFKPYKSLRVLLLQSISFLNLILLSGGVLYLGVESANTKALRLLVELSCGFAIIQFAFIVIWSLVKMLGCRPSNPFSKKEHSGNLSIPSTYKETTPSIIRFRDSILNESLLNS